MKPADAYLPCPRCGADSKATVHSQDRRAGTTTYRVWCEAHGVKQVVQ